MANSKGPSAVKSMYNGKHSLLPPKSPFPSIAPSYADYVPTPTIGPNAIPKYREGNSHHQRTSSESHLIEEQPSWLDELLDEPETPVRRGHRRSSSDSFAYVDLANTTNMDYSAQDEYRFRNITSVPWGSQDFNTFKDARTASFYAKPNSMLKHNNRPWESPPNALAQSSGLVTARDKFIPQNSVPICALREVDGISSATEKQKQDAVDSGMHDGKGAFERKDSSCAKASSETDTKRAKQQFAQRSRVRKLQYIAELERNVQALQVEGTEVSAELEFLNQQSLILSMENKALKQRLENLAQEQLIKYLEHEVLEREIGRLRVVYQQQQQPPQQPATSHRRTKSRDYLDSQFANLSLKNKDSAPAPRDPVSGPLHI